MPKTKGNKKIFYFYKKMLDKMPGLCYTTNRKREGKPKQTGKEEKNGILQHGAVRDYGRPDGRISGMA